MTTDSADVLTALIAFAVVFIVGLWAGIAMAWTMEVRFRRWAGVVARAYDRAASAFDEAAVGSGERGRGPSGVPPLAGTASASSASDSGVS